MNKSIKISLLLYVTIFWALQLACSLAYGDTADNIMQYSDAQINNTGKKMAEAISRASPAQVDAGTKLLGAIYAPDTKTIIYKYETTFSIETSKIPSYLSRQTCADPIRKALMYRGVKFKHIYFTPIGQETGVVKYQDCK